MGICHLQHRITTGLYVGRIFSPKLNSRYAKQSEHLGGGWGRAWRNETRGVIYSLTVTFYVFILLSILAVANKLPNNNINLSLYKNVNFITTTTVGVQFDIRNLLNSWALAAIIFMLKTNYYFLNFTTKKME